MKPSLERWTWLIILVLGLGLRVVVLIQRAGSATLLDQIDSQIYRNLATSLRSNGWWPVEGFFMSPLYPYGVAWMGVEGTAPIGLLLQCLLGVIAVAGLSWMVRSVAGPKAAVFTLGLGMLTGPLVLYDTSILPDGPSFAFLALALIGSVLPLEGRRTLLCGMAGALAFGLRSNLLLALVAAALWMFWSQRSDRAVALRRAGLFFAPTLAVMLGIGALNLKAEGVFVPRSINAGQNLYIGNNPTSDGTYTPVNEIHPGDMLGRAAAETISGRPLNASQVDRFWRDRSLSLMTENLGTTIRLWGKKLVLSVHPYDVPQMESLTLTRRKSSGQRVAMVSLLWALPLAIAGLWCLSSDQRSRLTPLFLCLAISVAICVVFFVNGRLRHPIWITILPLAGIGLSHLWVLAQARGPKRTVVGIVAGAAFTAILSLYPVHATYREAMSACRYATLEAMAGDHGQAYRWMDVAGEFTDRPQLQETFEKHPGSQWQLKLERAAAWFVLGEHRRAYEDIAPVAAALPTNRRAQEGLIQISDQLLQQSPPDAAAVQNARQQAVQRLRQLL